MDYYLHSECQKCGADIYESCFNTIEHNGKPVFELDEHSQTMMTCSECGYNQGTGDIDILGEDDF